MTDWFKWLIIALGCFAFIVLGYLIHTPKQAAPSVVVKTEVKYDTVTAVKRIYINRLVESQAKGDSVKSYTDTISGDTNEVAFNIKHSLKDSLKTIQSKWEVNIEPHLQIITKTITRDSIQTKVNTEYLPRPFFLDNYFWIAVGEFALIVLILLGKLI